MKHSSDMVYWTSDIDDSAAADAGEFTTTVYNLGTVFGEAPTRVFSVWRRLPSSGELRCVIERLLRAEAVEVSAR